MKKPQLPKQVSEAVKKGLSKGADNFQHNVGITDSQAEKPWRAIFAQMFFNYSIFLFKVVFYIIVMSASLSYLYKEGWAQLFLSIVFSVVIFSLGMAFFNSFFIKIIRKIKSKKANPKP